MKLFTGEKSQSQAKAVLSYLQGHDGLECSYKDGEYQATPDVYEWHNCREQGFVITLRSKDYSKQINIAFFEHRNSDSICAIKWEQVTVSGNPPTIETAKFVDVYKDKYDVSHSVEYGQCSDMAKWIYKELERFYVENEATKT